MELKGRLIENSYCSENLKYGMNSTYTLYIPKFAEGKENLALIVDHDGDNKAAREAMELSFIKGTMPASVFIGINSGNVKATLEGGFDRGMRCDNYDIFGNRYPDFLCDEILPHIIEKYNLKISASPDMHMIMGGSSGGISAFNAAWFRTDYFRRVYMSSPSFLSMNNGLEITALIRKFETKPIRVWSEFSENEPDDYFGSSFTVSDAAHRALKFANYDCNLRYYPDEGHCSRYNHVYTLMEVFEFIWKDYETPITPNANSPRFDKVFTKGEAWQKIDSFEFSSKKEIFIKGNGFTYTVCGNKIYKVKDGEKSEAYTFKNNIDAIALSKDGWKLYIAGKNLPCVYTLSILDNGELKGELIHSHIHRHTDFLFAGASDIAIDNHDRLFAATEIGIQAIRAWGLSDAIAPLPENLIPKNIEVLTEENKSFIVVGTEKGIYKREIEVYGELPENFPYPNSYYD